MSDYTFGLLYVISLALGMVLLDNVIDKLDPILSLLITSLFAVVFFHLATKTKLTTIYQTCWQHRHTWFMLNLVVSVMWLGTYYAVKWLNPTACLFLFFLSMTGTHWIRELYKERRLDKNVINVIFPVIFIAIFYFLNSQNIIGRLGVLAGVVAGIMGAYYNTYSKVFVLEGNLTSNDVLAVRFYVIILLAPFFITPAAIENITFFNVAQLMLVSIFTFILPLYMYQRSVMTLPLSHHVMIVAATPLVAYVIQGVAMQQWSLLLLCMSALTWLFLIGAEFLKR